MSIKITGRDPNAVSWPVNGELTGGLQTAPTGGYTFVGGPTTIQGVLSDNSDSTVVGQNKASAYFRASVFPPTMPAGSRVTVMSPYVRARAANANSKYKDFVIAVSDRSSPGGIKEIPGTVAHVVLANNIFQPFTCPNPQYNSLKQAITAADFKTGIDITFGMNTLYGASPAAAGVLISRAYMRFEYDMPPTATVTYPAPGVTINDTASPVVTWDYFDDFQPQAAYGLNIKQNGIIIYDSGLVRSATTAHRVTKNLPNGDYQVNIRVYQAWSRAGGMFPAQNLASANFTINVLKISPPRLSAPALFTDHVEVSVYPDVNLLNYDASTFDRSVLSWSTGNCTIARNTTTVRTGSASAALTATANPVILVSNANIYDANPGDAFKAQAFVNPGALTGKSGHLTINWFNAAGTQLSGVDGPTINFTVNTWNQLTITNAVAPANTATLQIAFVLLGQVAGNVMYIDSVGLYWQAGTNTLPDWNRGGFYEFTPNLLSYQDSSFETDDVTWAAEPFYTGTNLNLSFDQATHGSRSAKLTRTIAGTGSVGTTYGDYLQGITPGDTVWYLHSEYSTVARTVQILMKFFDANYAQISQPSSTYTSVANGWTINKAFSFTVPANAVFMQPQLIVQNLTTTTEAHYFDAVSIYNSTTNNGFVEGYLANTDAAPEVLVEYTDVQNPANSDFKTLTTIVTASTNYSFLVKDYTTYHGVKRTYRASLQETENGVDISSDSSGTVNATLNLSRVWIHAENDPAGTSYNFLWDGYGRTLSLGSTPTFTDVDGSAFPFVQYGVQQKGSVAVQVYLDIQADIDAMLKLANSKSTIVFRDTRGRTIRGAMGDVSFSDVVTGLGQTASFTLQYTALQP